MRVRLTCDRRGTVIVKPVSEALAARMKRDAVANGMPEEYGFELFIQEANPNDFVDDFPRSAFYRPHRGAEWNDGAQFNMDEWTFRHMVGWQNG